MQSGARSISWQHLAGAAAAAAAARNRLFPLLPLPLQPLLLKDLRIQCRARGLNPGGSREALLERVRDHMLETGNL